MGLGLSLGLGLGLGLEIRVLLYFYTKLRWHIKMFTHTLVKLGVLAWGHMADSRYLIHMQKIIDEYRNPSKNYSRMIDILARSYTWMMDTFPKNTQTISLWDVIYKWVKYKLLTHKLHILNSFLREMVSHKTNSRKNYNWVAKTQKIIIDTLVKSYSWMIDKGVG